MRKLENIYGENLKQRTERYLKKLDEEIVVDTLAQIYKVSRKKVQDLLDQGLTREEIETILQFED